MFTPPELARRLVAPLGPRRPLLDPSCGAGALLVAGLGASLDGGFEPAEALGRLHGLELDPRLAERARSRLEDLAPGAGPPDVRAVDALETRWPPGTWVVANPPYGALSGRASRRIEAGERLLLASRPGPGGWPSLHGPFLLRIARHVAAEGTGARVLLPAAVLESARYAPLREALAALVAPAEPPEDLGERAFPGVVLPTALVTWRPLGAREPDPESASAGLEPDRAAKSRPALVARLASHPRLPAGTFADPGLHTGNAARELVVRGGSEPPSPAHAPLREGRVLGPFDLGPPAAWVRTDLEPSPELRFRLRPLEHYASFPVLVRQTADRPIAALHTAPARFRNSLLAARAVEGLDPAFLVAILNSPVAAAWHHASFRDARQRTFPQVKVGHLCQLPFPIPHRDRDPGLHDELAARVRALDPRAGRGAFERELGAIAARTVRAFGLEGWPLGAQIELRMKPV